MKKSVELNINATQVTAVYTGQVGGIFHVDEDFEVNLDDYVTMQDDGTFVVIRPESSRHTEFNEKTRVYDIPPDKRTYDEKRASDDGYKPIGDQLDMMYHDKVNNTTTWQNHILDVKTKFPKPVNKG